MEDKDLEKVTGGKSIDIPWPIEPPRPSEPINPFWYEDEVIQWRCQKCGNVVWEGKRINQPSSYLYCKKCGCRVIDS